MCEILHITQHHCTEQHGGEKVKGHTFGDAYPHVDFWDVTGLEQLAWAIYDSVFIPGRVPDLLGCQDWELHCGGYPCPPDLSGENSLQGLQTHHHSCS